MNSVQDSERTIAEESRKINVVTELPHGVFGQLICRRDLMKLGNQLPELSEILEPEFHSELIPLEKGGRVKGYLGG